jgi:high-affinity iron transporter
MRIVLFCVTRYPANLEAKPMLRVVALLLFILPAVHAHADESLQRVLQTLDYVAVDYPEAVNGNGAIVSEAEYAEMREFTTAVRETLARQPQEPRRAPLLELAGSLERMVAERAAPASVADEAARLRGRLVDAYDVVTLPAQAPDLARAETLYARECAACHGAQGRGDGPQAAQLDPPPIDFSDRERYRLRTLYGVYSTITLGVPETAMAAYTHLSDQERWSLAFLVSGMAVSASDGGSGAMLPDTAGSDSPVADLRRLVTFSPAEVEHRHGPEAAALMAGLIRSPGVLFRDGEPPLVHARRQLAASLEHLREGDREAAYTLAVDAYLEGFELAEGGLNAVAPELRETIEHEMGAFRNALRGEAPVEALTQAQARIDGLLVDAAGALDQTGLSGGAAFTGSLVILLREGLEAILVVAALAAFLVKTGRRDALPYLHAGWAAALAAGFLTWWVSTYLVQIGGAGRELTEGVAALVAAAVLFYLGFWLHSKSQAAQWQRFIQERVNRALSATTLWSLAGLSFITVYREAFETILFYQALWVQTGADGRHMVFSGLAVATVLLVVLAWLILRFSTRLPLRQFFSVTGAFMFLLAIAFAGKGVVAMQEAGLLPSSPVGVPSIELLGIYPNLQSLGLQAALVTLGALMLLASRGRKPLSGGA